MHSLIILHLKTIYECAQTDDIKKRISERVFFTVSYCNTIWIWIHIRCFHKMASLGVYQNLIGIIIIMWLWQRVRWILCTCINCDFIDWCCVQIDAHICDPKSLMMRTPRCAWWRATAVENCGGLHEMHLSRVCLYHSHLWNGMQNSIESIIYRPLTASLVYWDN